MTKPDPTKPIPNDEKFKPQNVADAGSAGEPPSRNGDRPADTGGKDVQKGSSGDTRRASKGAR
jgi:hypothetical protein